MGSVTIMTYEGPTMPNHRIASQLGLESDNYIYVTATAALERTRRHLAPIATQRDHDGAPIMVFHKLLRHRIRSPILTRSEERVLLLRAIEALDEDASLRNSMRADAYKWMDALHYIQVIDYTDRAELDIVVPVKAVLDKLVMSYNSVLYSQPHPIALPFEVSACDYLDHMQDLPTKVVMEGFTFLTPLQKRFVVACASADSSLVMLFPDDPSQALGYTAIASTIKEVERILASGGHAEVCKRPDTLSQPSVVMPRNSDLAYLQSMMYAETAGPRKYSADGSVIITHHRYMHEEVAECVRSIRNDIEHGGIRLADIAVVVRDLATYRPRIQEEFARQGLPDLVRSLPRQILLSPSGRFVLLLYEIWQSGSARLEPDQFRQMLSSGWMGEDARTSVAQFEATRYQFFDRCRTFEDWRRCLKQLALAMEVFPGFTRLPHHAVESATPVLWARCIESIEGVHDALFADAPRTVSDHLATLSSMLARFRDPYSEPDITEIMDALCSAMTEVISAGQVEMTGQEFGQVLLGIASAEDETDNDESASMDDQLWITTPEGFDGCQAEHVYFVGLDDNSIPRPKSRPWPVWDPGAEGCTDVDRYLFLSVVRGTKSHLHLSYSALQQERERGPSSLLSHAQRVLQWASPSSTETAQVAETRAPYTVALSKEPRLPRNRYHLGELAVFRLCPRRYELEQLKPMCACYRDQAFQVGAACQAAWFRLNYSQMVGVTLDHKRSLVRVYKNVARANRKRVEQAFPALRAQDWNTAEHWVVEAGIPLERLDDVPDSVAIEVRASPGSILQVNVSGRVVEVDASPRFMLSWRGGSKPLLQDIVREWLLLPSNDCKELVTWFRRVMASALLAASSSPQTKARDPKEIDSGIEGLLADMERSDRELAYTPQPGNHCKCCPAKLECKHATRSES